MGKRTSLSLALTLLITAWCSAHVASQGTGHEPAANQVVLTSQVKWGPLNPARGDKSPKAGKLWGDRTGSGPSGFLVRFADGFSSPPHIHNITYRGVVISGLVHNDDPKAEKMWMPTGSFWTQPAGEVHITAAKGSTNLAYIEIDTGPYLVRPPKDGFDRGERPINVDASNVVWVDQFGTPASATGPKLAYLWGKPQEGALTGTLVKLPAGFVGKVRSHGSALRAVVIQGRIDYQPSGRSEVKKLEPGSYFGSEGKTVHQVSCKTEEECIIYVRADGKYDVLPS